MSFMKERIIYQSKTVRVYINECHAKGRKTRIFAVRRDDEKGYARYLGEIKWSGAWRQYAFFPKSNTMWAAGCKEEIAKFEREMNKKQREKWKKPQIKCFWCNKYYRDLITHTKNMHKGLKPRSYGETK